MIEKDYYTINEAAKLTSMCPSTVRTMCRLKAIDGIMTLGNTYAVPNSWVKMNVVPDGFVRASEAAKIAGISRAGLQKAVDSGKVDHIRRKFSKDKSFILINVKNGKWTTWLSEAQERSARHK